MCRIMSGDHLDSRSGLVLADVEEYALRVPQVILVVAGGEEPRARRALGPGSELDSSALMALIESADTDVKARL